MNNRPEDRKLTAHDLQSLRDETMNLVDIYEETGEPQEDLVITNRGYATLRVDHMGRASLDQGRFLPTLKLDIDDPHLGINPEQLDLSE